MSAREQALVIKGYLQAKEAPAPLLAGIEIILDELGSGVVINARIPIAQEKLTNIVDRFISKRQNDFIPAPEHQVTNRPGVKPDHIPEVTKMVPDHIAEPSKKVITPITVTMCDHNEDPLGKVEEKKPRKQRAPMTEEQRQACAERMRKLHADGRMKKGKALEFSLEEETPLPAPARALPRKDSDSDSLIQNQADYAGQREDKTLVDTDWGDIQKMRYNGLPDERIWKSYGVDELYFRRFVVMMEQRDEQQAKNF